MASGAPTFLSFFPFSTIAIVGILLAFRYELVNEGIDIISEYFDIKRTATIILLVVAVIILMIITHQVWSYVYYYYSRKRAQKEAELLYTKERKALVAIFNSMEGKLWRDKTRWCSDEPYERWKGVKVDAASGRVNKLILSENNLGGTIPPEIGDLECLKELDFRLNRIQGTLPETMSNLKRLEGIYLFDNFIKGKIPDAFSDLPRLTGIYLYNNCFDEVEASKKLFSEKVKEGTHVFI